VIDFEPTEEQSLVVETVRQFAENEIRPKARACDESGEPPNDVIAHAHELGLVANSLDESCGGGGERSAVTGVLIGEELAWGDLSIALAILSPALTALSIQDLGNAEQKQRWLPAFTREAFSPGSLALVEPGFESDPCRPVTRAVRSGGGWTISGDKCFVPWLEGTDSVVTIASTEAGPRAFVVPREADGLASKREANMGLRGLPTAELNFSGVDVGEDTLLGEGDGSDVTPLITRGRIALAAMAVGVARASYEIAREYAKEREAFGAPIATKQAIAFKLADMAIEIDGARLLVWEAAWQLDQGADAGRAAALARLQATQVSLGVADGAVQVLGGHGYIRDYLPEMHLRNARGFAHWEALALV
jgi:acyl-CoA dehydrogenase